MCFRYGKYRIFPSSYPLGYASLLYPRRYVMCRPPLQTHHTHYALPPQATFFELVTGLAFNHFARKEAEVVVLETGLGGRLDATNIVTPVVSIITSVGLDHTRILGDTIEKIAGEKAGIIKSGVPVVVGPDAPHHVLRDYAERRDSPFHALDNLEANSKDFDDQNSMIARAALDLMNEENLLGSIKDKHISQAAIDSGLASRPPCRFQLFSPPDGGAGTIVLDCGHNAPAMQSLLWKLKRHFPTARFRFVVGFSRDKDMAGCLKMIFQSSTDMVHLVQAAHPRAESPEVLLAAMEGHVLDDGRSVDAMIAVAPSVADGVTAALAAHQAQVRDGVEEVMVVCGSVFLMGEARSALGIDQASDSLLVQTSGYGSQFSSSQEHFTGEGQQAVEQQQPPLQTP
mmetsp:Transcript_54168/g.73998  ORF Transcript_54168/g.73998 Transcript_54168/m.73998 type:complete len:399 (-) Transcript_54168:490-1686(-)